MASKGLILLPLSVCLLQVMVYVGSYLVGSLYKGNLDYVPYPSDLVKEQPGRGIFCAGIGVSSALTLTIIIVRCMQVNTFYPRLCIKLNFVSFIMGITMTIGQNLVLGFPLQENDSIIYYIGTLLFFVSGCFFMIIQAHISRNHPFNHIKCIVNFRIVCVCVGFLCTVAYITARLLAPIEKQRYYIPQSSEWMLSLIMSIFMGSFAWDFSKIRIRLNSYEVSPRSRAGTERLFCSKERETNI